MNKARLFTTTLSITVTNLYLLITPLDCYFFVLHIMVTSASINCGPKWYCHVIYFYCCEKMLFSFLKTKKT
jgi:hypothetical protein